MKIIYIVHGRLHSTSKDDIKQHFAKVFENKEDAIALFEKSREKLKRTAKRYSYYSSVFSKSDAKQTSFSVYLDCEDSYYEGQTYFVQMQQQIIGD